MKIYFVMQYKIAQSYDLAEVFREGKNIQDGNHILIAKRASSFCITPKNLAYIRADLFCM